MIHHLWLVAQHLQGDRTAERQADHVRGPAWHALANDGSHTPSGILEPKRPNRGAVPTFGEIGSQAVIEVGQALKLRLPHGAAQSQAVQKEHGGGSNGSCFTDR